MRIRLVRLEKHRPFSEDKIVMMDEYGNVLTLLDSEVENALIEAGQLCEYCLGSGKVEKGEHDDIVEVPCPCQNRDDEDKYDPDLATPGRGSSEEEQATRVPLAK